jgi:hypothetical protein
MSEFIKYAARVFINIYFPNTRISCPYIYIFFFILFKSKKKYIKDRRRLHAIKHWILQTKRQNNRDLKQVTFFFATVLMYKITAPGYLKSHKICFLFQMEDPASER